MSQTRAASAAFTAPLPQTLTVSGAGTGNGTAPNLRGILNRTGIQTVTGYAMSTIDSIYKGITQVRAVAFSEPSALVVHPQDWFDIRTSKAVTGGSGQAATRKELPCPTPL